MSQPPAPLPAAEKLRLESLGVLPVLFPTVGILGLLSAFIWGLATNPMQLAFSYLFAFSVGFTICAGGLFWTLLHHALDADWSVLMRRILESIASCFPVLLVLFIPIAFLFSKELWHWMTTDLSLDPLLAWKRRVGKRRSEDKRMVHLRTAFSRQAGDRGTDRLSSSDIILLRKERQSE